MKKTLKYTWGSLQLIIFGAIYYIGSVWGGITLQRKNYDFELWKQSPMKIARDTRLALVWLIIITLILTLGWVWTFIVSLGLLMINAIVLFIIGVVKYLKK